MRVTRPAAIPTTIISATKTICGTDVGNAVRAVSSQASASRTRMKAAITPTKPAKARRSAPGSTRVAMRAPMKDPAIAAYYAKQVQTPGTADPASVELGERIYRGGNPATGLAACSGCHGPAGVGLGAAKFPRISGQHAQYLDSTLKGFRAGARANDPNGMMRDVAGRMSDTEIAAVAQYVQGLSQ